MSSLSCDLLIGLLHMLQRLLKMFCHMMCQSHPCQPAEAGWVQQLIVVWFAEGLAGDCQAASKCQISICSDLAGLQLCFRAKLPCIPRHQSPLPVTEAYVTECHTLSSCSRQCCSHCSIPQKSDQAVLQPGLVGQLHQHLAQCICYPRSLRRQMLCYCMLQGTVAAEACC